MQKVARWGYLLHIAQTIGREETYPHSGGPGACAGPTPSGRGCVTDPGCIRGMGYEMYNFNNDASDYADTSTGTNAPSNGFVTEVASAGVGVAAGAMLGGYLGVGSVVGGVGGGAIGLGLGSWWAAPAEQVTNTQDQAVRLMLAQADASAAAAKVREAEVKAAAQVAAAKAQAETAAASQAAQAKAEQEGRLQLAGLVLHGIQQAAAAAAQAKAEAEAKAKAEALAAATGKKTT